MKFLKATDTFFNRWPIPLVAIGSLQVCKLTEYEMMFAGDTADLLRTAMLLNVYLQKNLLSQRWLMVGYHFIFAGVTATIDTVGVCFGCLNVIDFFGDQLRLKLRPCHLSAGNWAGRGGACIHQRR